MNYVLLLFLFSPLNCFSQTFEKNTIYLLGRGSISKQSLIADNFNIEHKKLTHIAVGYLKKDSLVIYDISVEGGVNSRITKSNWEEFKFIDKNYLGIWGFKTNSKNILKLDKEIEILIKKQISYNFDFNLKIKDKMYCSQLIAFVLNKLTCFNFKPTKIKLNPTYKSLLKTENLSCYPVDFFIKKRAFKIIYEIF